MAYALNLSFPSFSSTSTSTRISCPSRGLTNRIFCSSPPQSYGEHDDEDNCNSQKKWLQKPNLDPSRTLFVERYEDGTIKRYILDDDSRLQTILEEHRSMMNELQEVNPNNEISWLPHVLKDFIFPAGFPESVSDDYLEYMLLQFPTNVTAWICHTLVTSSLLKAVGVGSFSGTTAAASAAAVRWVSKDGLGAIGRLFIGGRFGNLFDDDPKQWRMYADFIGSAGSIFELTTPLYPAYFLPLASLGNLAKAIARGLKDPSFRVIQNHFATSGNLGEVAAKEEVWEVAAQLIGLALGILVMDAPGFLTSYPMLVFTWLSMRLLHLWLRYQSLSVLRFTTINLKRARDLVKSHILHSTVPGYGDCNKEENILSWERFLKPRIHFGVSLEEMIGGESSSHMLLSMQDMHTMSNVGQIKALKKWAPTMKIMSYKSGDLLGTPVSWLGCYTHSTPGICVKVDSTILSIAGVKDLLELYAKEHHILVMNKPQQLRELEIYVSFKVGATSMTVLRSLWQAYWLHEHWGGSDHALVQLRKSLFELEGRFNDFLKQLEASGWDILKINLKVPKELVIEVTAPMSFPIDQ
ncbi:protein root UVB sensitive 5 isoform X3 [Magnolia sinica]|uniref:protein root UVB sensitive 5 isoform X3 n=1 Tax=Magnolia sinica TaxID=86752 RepID=UPI0026585527|nr:protein root UVB sensitive 5 isoform X3 [Magnolia sinica]